MKLKKYLLTFVCFSCAIISNGQAKKLTLLDLSDFQPQAGNWMIVGDVVIDPTISIHDKPAPQQVVTPGKRGKNIVSTVQPPPFQPVKFSVGSGILLNMNTEQQNSHLVTKFEHGDMELELELMVPKGSNSGIYLQGRYEVQILDSWGVKAPKFSDLGGIYRNWENQPGKIYMGKAPLSNPAKAPGLWQKLRIVFKAPRFDASGKKIANARFVSVELNGIKIHDQLEVPLPTGGPIANNEVPMGPLMIQGDHGPVAFRNVSVRMLREVTPTIGDVQWATYVGRFKTFNDFLSLKPSASGISKELTCEVLDREDGYASSYKTTLQVPEAGKYEFELVFSGGARLAIDGATVIDWPYPDDWPRKFGSMELTAGPHSLEILNYKDAGWAPPRLALFVKLEGANKVQLHDFNSYPPSDDPVSAILINPTQKPRLLRAFLDFKGQRMQRLTHTIGVGEPTGINYVFDLKAGNLVCLWRGNFVDATPMWHDRGDGSFKPMGATEYTFTTPPLAFLNSPEESFPTVASEADFRGLGYEIDEITNRPTFKYTYKGLEVSSSVAPDEAGKLLTHTISLKDRGRQPGLTYKLAEGKTISDMGNGYFAIDDKRYFIVAKNGLKPVIRKGDGKQELVAAFEGSTIQYSIIW